MPDVEARNLLNEARKLELKGSYLINPDGMFRQAWDVVQVFMLAYLAIATPFVIGFDRPDPPWGEYICVRLPLSSRVATELAKTECRSVAQAPHNSSSRRAWMLTL